MSVIILMSLDFERQMKNQMFASMSHQSFHLPCEIVNYWNNIFRGTTINILCRNTLIATGLEGVPILSNCANEIRFRLNFYEQILLYCFVRTFKRKIHKITAIFSSAVFCNQMNFPWNKVFIHISSQCISYNHRSINQVTFPKASSQLCQHEKFDKQSFCQARKLAVAHSSSLFSFPSRILMQTALRCVLCNLSYGIFELFKTWDGC